MTLNTANPDRSCLARLEELGYSRVYHYHIRKTAGTSLNSAFWSLAGLDLGAMGQQCFVKESGLIFVRGSKTLIEGGQYFFANSHIPAHKVTLPARTFTITIVRDPLQRVLSHYRYLLWILRNPGDPREPYMESLRTELAWVRRGFGEFAAQLPREHLLRQLYMFSRVSDVEEATDRILSCSAVCFTESFGADLRRVSETLSLNLPERHERAFSPPCLIHPTELAIASRLLESEYLMLAKVRRALGIVST